MDWMRFYENIEQTFWYLVELFKMILFVVVAYFFPISGMVHVVLACFIIDVFYGWKASKKLEGKKFSTGRVLDTALPRFFFSLVVLMLTYTIDKEAGQGAISTYKIVGWAISYVLIVSIAKNAYSVLNWEAIKSIQDITSDKLDLAKLAGKILKKKKK